MRKGREEGKGYKFVLLSSKSKAIEEKMERKGWLVEFFKGMFNSLNTEVGWLPGEVVRGPG